VRPAFDKMLTPHISNLRAMFPQVEQHVLATKIMKTNCNKLCNETATMTLKRKPKPAAVPSGGGP